MIDNNTGVIFINYLEIGDKKEQEKRRQQKKLPRINVNNGEQRERATAEFFLNSF
jgi:hypothetical protein